MSRVLRYLALLAPFLSLTVALAQPASTSVEPVASAAPATPPVENSQAPAVPNFPVEDLRLPNGLRVVLAPDTNLPNVAVMVRYNVGSSDDPDGLRGIAHLVEHLTYERTTHLARGSMLRLLSNAGASTLNGRTDWDGTVYFEVMPPERLELALWVESDRMGYFLGAVDEKALEQEKRVVASELRTRYYDRPAGLLQLATLDAAFPLWHPYHPDAEGWQEDTDSITLEDVRAFYGTWYGPENALLILTGHFDSERAKKLLEKYFATLPGRPTPQKPMLPKLEHTGTTRIELDGAVGRESVELSWVTPSFGLPGDTELDWIATILTSGEQSRLVQRLVHGGLAVSVAARQASKQRASIFIIHAIVQKGHIAEELIAAIDKELSSLMSLGPTQAEMDRALSYWEKSDLFELETALGRAELIRARTMRPGPLLPIDWREHSGAAPSADNIRAAAAKHLSPTLRDGEVIVRPVKTAPLSGTIVRRVTR